MTLRSWLRCGLFGVAALSLLQPGVSTAAAAPAAPSAVQIVKTYNSRDFGNPGWRRIHLELMNNKVVSRIFTVIHIFQKQGDQIRSLVLLEEPVSLQGTSYLLTEGAGLASGMDLYLHLPTGNQQVLNIKPSHFDEGLLGSDFSYSDLRWQIPIKGNDLRLLGATSMAGHPAWKVELTPASPESREIWSWKRIVYYLASDGAGLLGADFFGPSPTEPVKRLRIISLEKRGEVWTPTRMEMTLAGGRSSVLTLKDSGFGSGHFKPELFSPSLLPSLGDQIKMGKGSEILAGGRR